jgi:hypothetical protein
MADPGVNSEVVTSAHAIDKTSAAASAALPDYILSADYRAAEPDGLCDDMPSDLSELLPQFIGRHSNFGTTVKPLW